MKGKEPESVYDLPLEKLERLLTEQQKRFVEELDKGCSPKEAAIHAGYSEKTAESQASRLLKNVKIAAYRRARSIDLYQKQGISPEWVGNQLIEVYRRCMSAVPHLTWDSKKHAYVPDGTWIMDVNGAIKTLTKIGESMGMFHPKETGTEKQGTTIEEFLQGLDKGRKF